MLPKIFLLRDVVSQPMSEKDSMYVTQKLLGVKSCRTVTFVLLLEMSRMSPGRVPNKNY